MCLTLARGLFYSVDLCRDTDPPPDGIEKAKPPHTTVVCRIQLASAYS